ncbi:MAG TPA: hypothetical protein PKB14_19710 [Rubrivivax sp.]|nr:hypothetical protein [Rubrivivax sp.]
MKFFRPLALVCAAFALTQPALAQDKPAAKRAAVKPANKPNPEPAAPLPTLSTADPEQLLAAAQTYMGAYDCEFKQTLSITRHPTDGYVVVTFGSKAYTMKPVRSPTGAVRLEEVGNGPMLMVQIPAKSMLMDTSRGRRIVDACVNEVQAKEVVTDANALGMNLPGQVDTSGIAVTQSPTTRR